MKFAREGGILLHPTSLPGRFGIGDLGQGAIAFIQFLEEAGLRLWQILPLGPTGYGNSPYQTLSAFAGNHLLISLDRLVEEGLLKASDLDNLPEFPADHVDYGRVIPIKTKLLQQASHNFHEQNFPELQAAFDAFCQANHFWLEDYALFRAIKDFHKGSQWTAWPAELVGREPAALEHWRQKLALDIAAIRFEQFLFYKQWHAIKEFANSKSIKIIGDIPIFIAHDSADVWANQHLFFLDAHGEPESVAGVPPDYFSKTGQRWGNPLYRWDLMPQDNYSWWLARLSTTLHFVDIIRLDHFRGFEAYWEVPAREETAIHGRWVKGPGAHFFHAAQHALGDLPILAEDLGIITAEVAALRDQFGFPGMRILQFGFDEDEGSRFFLPHNYPRNCVVYTGTHDNDTCVGWFTSEDGGHSTRSMHEVRKERERAIKYMGCDHKNVHWQFIRLAFSSIANQAIVPMQDVLGLGTEARMNLPGKPDGNWEWRYQAQMLAPEIKYKLAEYIDLYDRQGKFYD